MTETTLTEQQISQRLAALDAERAAYEQAAAALEQAQAESARRALENDAKAQAKLAAERAAEQQRALNDLKTAQAEYHAALDAERGEFEAFVSGAIARRRRADSARRSALERARALGAGGELETSQDLPGPEWERLDTVLPLAMWAMYQYRLAPPAAPAAPLQVQLQALIASVTDPARRKAVLGAWGAAVEGYRRESRNALLRLASSSVENAASFVSGKPGQMTIFDPTWAYEARGVSAEIVASMERALPDPRPAHLATGYFELVGELVGEPENE